MTDFVTFQTEYFEKLLKQAHMITIDTLEKKTQSIVGQSIVKSISANKKRPS